MGVNQRVSSGKGSGCGWGWGGALQGADLAPSHDSLSFGPGLAVPEWGRPRSGLALGAGTVSWAGCWLGTVERPDMLVWGQSTDTTACDTLWGLSEVEISASARAVNE